MVDSRVTDVLEEILAAVEGGGGGGLPDSGWITLTLEVDWEAVTPPIGADPTVVAPAVRKIGSVVYGRGYAATGGDNGTAIMVIPEGFRPATPVIAWNAANTALYVIPTSGMVSDAANIGRWDLSLFPPWLVD